MTTGNLATSADPLSTALDEIAEMSSKATDGKWLERLTAECAPLIAEWDVDECWLWTYWPEREQHYQHATDIGIDVVARRASDGALIAIQCKSRQLDADGRGADITKHEFNSFIATSSDARWAERWLVTNGDVRLGAYADAVVGQKPAKLANLESDLLKQRESEWSALPEPCPHCDGTGSLRTRDCMQREAVETSVRILRDHAAGDGKARGRIILPCGTGKSRIALRIVEELARPGEVSAVLCPSIALVAQLRREFLANSEKPMKALAVCSDETAGHGSDLSRDQTADIGQASASEVKGLVTTAPGEIGSWIEEVARERNRIGVIFGTYQSSHRIAEALVAVDCELSTVIADEAHRTAGLRRIRAEEEKLRDFTVCHDDRRFPAKFRVYQTATPRVYDTGSVAAARRSSKNDEWVVRNMDDESVFGVELYRKSYADAVANRWLTDYRIIALGVNDEDAYRTANDLAAGSGKKLSTAQFLRGLTLALVMGGATRQNGAEIRSSINFMNTIAKSKEMTSALESKTVRDWVQRRLNADGGDREAAHYRLEHLDASSKVSARE